MRGDCKDTSKCVGFAWGRLIQLQLSVGTGKMKKLVWGRPKLARSAPRKVLLRGDISTQFCFEWGLRGADLRGSVREGCNTICGCVTKNHCMIRQNSKLLTHQQMRLQKYCSRGSVRRPVIISLSYILTRIYSKYAHKNTVTQTQTYSHPDRQRDRQTERQTDTHTDTDTHTHNLLSTQQTFA